MRPRPPRSTLFPYTTLFRSEQKQSQFLVGFAAETNDHLENGRKKLQNKHLDAIVINNVGAKDAGFEDRKSTRLNSSHVAISYAVFCLKKKKKKKKNRTANV